MLEELYGVRNGSAALSHATLWPWALGWEAAL